MNTFKFFELSDNGFTADGMYAQSVIHVSVDLAEVKKYVKEIIGMNPDEIPVDPEKALVGYVIRTREIKY